MQLRPLILSTLSLALVFSVQTLAFGASHELVRDGGGMTSSGAEFLTTENNPWFIGDEVVHYCIERSDAFSLSREGSSQILRDVFVDWTRTITKLKPIETAFVLPDGKKKNLTLRFEEVDCIQSHELTFLLGVNTPDVETTLNHMARYTAAFAAKVPVSDETGRTSQGMIWLTADRGDKAYAGPATPLFWSQPDVFYSVIAHEIGHIFGLQHGLDGIMNEDVPARILIRPPKQKVTPAIYEYSGWQNRGDRFCGNLDESAFEKVRQLLKVPYVIEWKLCVSPENAGHFTGPISVEFISAKELVHRSFKFSPDYSHSYSYRANQDLSGQYFADRVRPDFYYQHHQFLDFSDLTIRGHLDFEGKAIPMIISSHGPRVDLTLVQGSDFVDFSFYMNDRNPFEPGELSTSTSSSTTSSGTSGGH